MISFWAGKGSGYTLSQPDQQGLKEAMFPSKNAKYRVAQQVICTISKLRKARSFHLTLPNFQFSQMLGEDSTTHLT